MAWYTVNGEPVRAGELTVTPRSRVLSLQAGPAAFVWQMPTSVLVERPGSTHSLRIVDVTRIAQVALVVLALLIRRIR